MSDEPHTGACIVATVAPSDPVNELSQEDQAHVTLLWLGERAELDPGTEDQIRQHVQSVSMERGEFRADVSGRAVLGKDDAGVLLLESIALVELRNALFDHPAVRQAWLGADQFPIWIPHLTLTYGGGLPAGDLPDRVHLDGLGLWLAGVHEPFALRTSGRPIDDPNWFTATEPTDPRALLVEHALSASIIPPVMEPADLPLCVQFAIENPGARWYAERTARSMGLSQLIPRNWEAATS